MDGIRSRLSILFCLAFALSIPELAAGAVSPPPELMVTAKLRDFQEANPADQAATHPHFNTYNACSALELDAPTVEDALALDDAADGGLFPGDTRGPALRKDMPSALGRCFEPAERFGDWFQDRDGDVNRAFLTELRFVHDPATGLYRFKSTAFFPLDQGQPLDKLNAGDPDPFGHLQTGAQDGIDLSLHNYGFTLEMHTRIVYEAGKAHSLTFQGDDDIWVFVAGRKVVDLGGVHQTQSATVNLDSLAAGLGLEDGMDYPMDFFFAERHVASSSIQITANLHIPSARASIRKEAGRSFLSAGIPAGSRVEVYDRAGRLVRLLAQQGGAPAPAWDGRDGHGRPAVPGVYFWRALSARAPALSGWVVAPSE